MGWFTRLTLFLLAFGLCAGLLAMVFLGKTLHLPVWAVAEIESRVNERLSAAHLPAGVSVSLGAVEVAVDPDLSGRLVLRDIRLLEPGGQTALSLPELRTDLSLSSLFERGVTVTSVRLSGARIGMIRDEEGRLALSFGSFFGGGGLQRPADLLDRVEQILAQPGLADLRVIEADALTLSLQDVRAGRTWEVGDGRLMLENRPEGLSAELGLTLLDGETPARARMYLESSRADSSARFGADIEHLSSGDLAAQAPPLAILSIVEAPISGAITGEMDAKGALGRFEGNLSLASGRLHAGAPAPEGGEARAPVAFERAEMALRYDPALQRVWLDRLQVESASLRLDAKGNADLLDATGGPAAPGEWPEQVVAQFGFAEVMVDPEGLFVAPARFSGGALDFRLRLRPLSLDLGQLTLTEGDEHLVLSGRLADGPKGWSGALDVRLNKIGTDRLIRLWPVSVVPRTRDWLAQNVGQGALTDVAAALRFSPGEEPRFALDYEFSGAEVRFIRSLPPISDGHGRSAIQGNSYLVVVEGGHVTAPEGGRIAVDGSLFRVIDITQKPAEAEVRLITDAGLTATLSLLDQQPFRFLQKAGQRADLGEGRAVLISQLRFPLLAKLAPDQVEFDVQGRVVDFSSDKLVKGRRITSPDVAVRVTPTKLTLSGAGALDGLPVVVRYEQPLGPGASGASVRGTARATPARLKDLGISLPEGWLSGETGLDFELALPKGETPVITLSSDLAGMRLSVPELGWSKPAGTTGRLDLKARLGAAAEVTALSLNAAGLRAEGSLTTLAGGGLERARFTRLTLGNWLDVSAEVTGQGNGRAPAVRLTGGTLDLRKRPESSGGSSGTSAAMDVALDRLIVSESIALTGLSGRFTPRGSGLDGSFVAAVNGQGRVQGTTVPARGGTAVRLTSSDAGRVMAASGIFRNGRGGSLDLTLQPSGQSGGYRGSATFADLSVEDAPVLAAMLSAASVVGLLEQLNGQGILFNEGEVDFSLSRAGVQIDHGAAMGASMGISFAGVWRADTDRLDIEGTLSPIYVLNGIGRIFAPRNGEGLFGFNYRLSGPARSPKVTVNPLSILTPGLFREIFRRPMPKLGSGG